MAFACDLPGIFALQHSIIKQMKKKLGLRQRDFEVLCACYQLSLAKFTFTTAKVNDYLQGSYFLHSIYDSMNVLVGKGYLSILVPGKPFNPERYEFSYKGRELVKSICREMRQASETIELQVVGKNSKRLW